MAIKKSSGGKQEIESFPKKTKQGMGLNTKYSAANTVNIIHNFMPHFEDRTVNMRLIADNLHRSRVVLQLKAWFNQNIGCFEL